MAYTKYSLTPANNNATPPDGAPEGMLPSAVNDTMRDMMAQIRDVGDGIRNGTYTMTAPVITGGSITGVALSGNTFTNPVITGGSINNTPIGASTANTGAFTTLSANGATTFSGATVVSGSLTANTFSSSGATITGGSINSTAIGGSTAAAGAFTTLSASGEFSANGGATLGDASGDALTINSSAVSIPNGLNFDSNTFVIDATNNRVGVGTASPAYSLDVSGIGQQYINATTTDNTTTSVSGLQALSASGNNSIAVLSHDTARIVTRYGLTLGGWNEITAFGTSSNGLILGTNTGDPVVFGTSNLERMRITSTGLVGIGTSSPTTRLQIGDTTVSADNILKFGKTASAAQSTLPYISQVSESSAGTSNDLQLFAGGSGAGRIILNSYDFVVKTGGGTSPSGTERLRIDSSGNVGIGTTSPAHVLSVFSSSASLASFTRDLATDVSLNVSADNDGTILSTGGVHAFRVFTNNLERMRLDSSGNLGLGVTPSAWGASRFAIDMGSNAYVGGTALSHLTNNVFFNGTNFIYKTTATSGMYQIAGNAHQWYSAASGTAGNAITFTEAMRLDSSGNLGLGVTPSAWSQGRAFQFGFAGTIWHDDTSAIGNTRIGNNWYFNSGFKYKSAGAASYYQQGAGSHYWFSAPSGTADAAATFTQAMTLDASGNLLVGLTSARANAGDVQVSKGISFPATQSAQSDANTLDDYEEGTANITLTPQTGSLGTVAVNASYTKIGRLVTILADFECGTVSSPSGTLKITGLPFTASGGMRGAQAVISRNGFNFSGGGAGTLFGNIEGSSTEVDLYIMLDNGGVRLSGLAGYVATGASFNATITYFTS